jgi:glucose dehydrogenase
MYVSTAWSMVKAYDAATGKLLWSTTRAARDRREAVDVVNGVAA